MVGSVRRIEVKGGKRSEGQLEKKANRKPSKAENGKEMVRKVTTFPGEVMVV